MSEHQGLTCCLSSVCCNSDALIQAGPRLQAGCMVLFRIDGIHLLQRRVKPDKTLRLHIMASMSQTNGADCRPSVGRPYSRTCARQYTGVKDDFDIRAVQEQLKPCLEAGQVRQTHKASSPHSDYD